MVTQTAAEIVSDPVAHISISGVHGRKELNERLARPRANGAATDITDVLIGVAIGAALMYFFKR